MFNPVSMLNFMNFKLLLSKAISLSMQIICWSPGGIVHSVLGLPKFKQSLNLKKSYKIGDVTME